MPRLKLERRKAALPKKKRCVGDPVSVLVEDDDDADCLSAMLCNSNSPTFEGTRSMKRPLYPIFESPPACQDAAAILEEEGVEDQVAQQQQAEKKRRLSVEQVKSLERYFELENKLEPERKMQLARELGLQPRQVAVWFQNRRARWKTKQLEKDYDALKSSLDSLKSDYSDLLQEKLKLQAEVQRLNEIVISQSDPRKSQLQQEQQHDEEEPQQYQQQQYQQQEQQQQQQPLSVRTELKVKVEEGNDTSNKSRGGTVISTTNLLSCRKDCSVSDDSDESEIVDEESPRMSTALLAEAAPPPPPPPPSSDEPDQQQDSHSSFAAQMGLDMGPLECGDIILPAYNSSSSSSRNNNNNVNNSSSNNDMMVNSSSGSSSSSSSWRAPKLEGVYYDFPPAGFLALEGDEQGDLSSWWEWS